ncbi:BfmA/BtgA family mobilization protein [Pedobacter hartonius]|uniref:Uncharacterized protein n=1 Tax=Pedobacter hartonius TaxID=425514 RepID=A0A1H4HKG3_9SPHI|nr:BfmA/BtgA family mobilization protein [Pedobacter hartonius]SEB21572.1 hypothetical protein SAMN05443550_12028 [Pedobacter hartonius]
MSTETLRTIKYTPQTAMKFDKVALKLGRSNRLVFAQMVDYFYRSKKDPLDINDELLKNTLLKHHKDYIGFIKTQENDLLIPIKREVDRMIRNQRDIVIYFDNQEKHNKTMQAGHLDLVASQNVQLRKLNESDQEIKIISRKLTSKEQMKIQFHYIMNNYIKNRDAFGMMTSAKEKDDLIQKTKHQIDLL